MRDCQAAQAAALVRALRHQLHEMTIQLARLERQGITGRNGRACAVRLEAAALRRDIRQAKVLIDRLQRRYLNGDGGATAIQSYRGFGRFRSLVTRNQIDPARTSDGRVLSSSREKESQHEDESIAGHRSPGRSCDVDRTPGLG
jgi:hypothetical protein